MEYVYNDDWWKSVLDKRCPDKSCNSNLIFYKVKTTPHYECTKCDLVVTGNPKLLAYTPIASLEDSEEQSVVDTVFCPECRSGPDDHYYDDVRSELSCKKCGLVLDGNGYGVDFPRKGLINGLIWRGYINTNYSRYAGPPSDYDGNCGNRIHDSCRR